MPDVFQPPFLIAVLAGLFGGIVRGYSGFGFALAAVPVLTINMPPSIAIPAVFPLELAIGLLTLPFEFKNADRGVLNYLILGAVIGTPLGITLLKELPTEWTRIFVGLAVVWAVVRAWKPKREATPKSRRFLALIGFASGCLNGGTAMSGPPVIVTLLDGFLPTAIARATLIGFIAISALFGVLLALLSGSYTDTVLLTSLKMTPTVIIGCAIGIGLFSLVPHRSYRTVSLSLLMLAVCISLGSTVWHLCQSAPQ